MGFSSATDFVNACSCTAKLMLGFPECEGDQEWDYQYDAHPLRGPYIVAAIPPRIMLSFGVLICYALTCKLCIFEYLLASTYHCCNETV